MISKIDYNNCLTNLACSIQKYFGLEYKHSTLADIDALLEARQPENVILMLYDGMGSRILKRNCDSDSFFVRNMRREFCSIFPPTTAAATTSVVCGLNPVETGWVGWSCYIKPLDKVIEVFRDREKGHSELCQEFVDFKPGMAVKTIVETINEAGKYQAYNVSPFSGCTYETLDEMLDNVLELSRKEGRKFIYAYNNEPDHTMHDHGCQSPEALACIRERDGKTAALAEKLENSVLIIVADHGHVDVKSYYLTDYPDLMALLERNIAIEPRAVSFKVKEGLDIEFRDCFDSHFGRQFTLLTAQEVKDMQLFGPGEPHWLFDDEIGDYLSNTTVADDIESKYKSLYDYLSEEVSKVPPGANGVVFTPWLHGNRCPFEDSRAGGMFFNIRIENGKRDMIRAVLEGICYHLRWLLECEAKKVKTSNPIRFVGGGALSPVTCQMLADITGRTIETVGNAQEVGAIGAALVVAAGIKGVDALELSRKLVKVDHVYVPNPNCKDIYERNYKVFKKLYKANAANFKMINA